MNGIARGADVVICTPFRNVEAFAPHTASLATSLIYCWGNGIRADFWPIMGDSYIWRSRNAFAHNFLHKTEAEHLIFIDSDHAWNPQGFVNLLKAPVEVCGAAYPCKNNWTFWGVSHFCNPDFTPQVDPKTGLIKAVGIPTGFMKIARSAFEKIRDYEPDNYYEGKAGEKIHGFFNQMVVDGVALGEDISFCHRLRQAGVEMWIEPDITIEHYGTEAHRGNYHEFLLQQSGGSHHKYTGSRITELAGKHQGETLWIVGKGPSLAHLRAEHFGPGPVIAINQAIITVAKLGLPNPIYSMQKDGGVDMVDPCGAILLLHEHESKECFPEYTPRFIFDNPIDFGLPINCFSSATVIHIAQLMGCSKLTYICHDACVNGNTECYVPRTNGDYEVQYYATVYKEQAQLLKAMLSQQNLPVEWLLPGED